MTYQRFSLSGFDYPRGNARDNYFIYGLNWSNGGCLQKFSLIFFFFSFLLLLLFIPANFINFFKKICLVLKLPPGKIFSVSVSHFKEIYQIIIITNEPSDESSILLNSNEWTTKWKFIFFVFLWHLIVAKIEKKMNCLFIKYLKFKKLYFLANYVQTWLS